MTSSVLHFDVLAIEQSFLLNDNATARHSSFRLESIFIIIVYNNGVI